MLKSKCYVNTVGYRVYVGQEDSHVFRNHRHTEAEMQRDSGLDLEVGGR